MEESVIENINIVDQWIEKAVDFSPRIILALLTLLIGFWIANKVSKFIDKQMELRGVEVSLRKFLSSILGALFKVLVLFSCAKQLGFETTSLLAIFGALMVGVGMALNGSLGHLASGIMLMIFKPFKVGDLVEIGGGHRGTVEAINAFNTSLATLDNKRIYVSNSNVTGNTITNISGQGIVGVELVFGIGYSDSIDKARDIILRIGKECPHILEDPAQSVVVAELADSSVNLATRPFCKSQDFFATKFYMQENVKKAFDAEGIGIPFPQMDIHMIKEN